MAVENIILSEVSQVQKVKGLVFYIWNIGPIQIHKYYIYIEIHTEHVSKSRYLLYLRRSREEEKKDRKIMNNNQRHHI
jgi:hypothetical protein